jgi:hypothetical protein
MREREYCQTCNTDITHSHCDCYFKKGAKQMNIEKTGMLLSYLSELKGFVDALPYEDIKGRFDKVSDEIEKELSIGNKVVGELKVKIDGSEVAEYIHKELERFKKYK